MGESVFIQPMKRWLQRKQKSRPVLPADPDDSFEEDDLASLRDIFDLSGTGTNLDLETDPEELNPVGSTTVGGPDRNLQEMEARLQALESERSQLMTQLNGGERPVSSQGTAPNKGLVQRAHPVSSESEVVPTASPVSESDTGTEPAAVGGLGIAGSLHGLDSLPGTLKGAFSGTVEFDQQIRSLSQRRGGLRMQELSDELYDFVRRIGALGGGR